jgi:hypothetical protein
LRTALCPKEAPAGPAEAWVPRGSRDHLPIGQGVCSPEGDAAAQTRRSHRQPGTERFLCGAYISAMRLRNWRM